MSTKGTREFVVSYELDDEVEQGVVETDQRLIVKKIVGLTLSARHSRLWGFLERLLEKHGNVACHEVKS